MTITSLPTDVVGCIVQHIQHDAWQSDQKLDDVAALRGVCRFLRHAVDLAVTCASIHANVGEDELRTITHKFKGLHTVKLQHIQSDTAASTLETLATVEHLQTLDMHMSKDMQLEDWTKLSGLTGLTLRHVDVSHHRATLAAVLPQLTSLRSLALAEDDSPALPATQELDVRSFTSLTQLTHLDLGLAAGVAALAPQLPNLQSLALRLPYPIEPVACMTEMSTLQSLTNLRWLSLAAGHRSTWRASNVKVTVSLWDAPSGGTAGISDGAASHSALQAQQGARCSAALQLAAWLVENLTTKRLNFIDMPDTVVDNLSIRELRVVGGMHGRVLTCDAARMARIAGRLRVLHLVYCGDVAPLLRAAVWVEDVELRHYEHCGMLAELRPMVGTLRRLDATRFFDNPVGRAAAGLSADHTRMSTGDVCVFCTACNNRHLQLGFMQGNDGDVEPLAALTGLTHLKYNQSNTCVVRPDAIQAVGQLTRLRELQLTYANMCGDSRLAQLSALGRLTSLDVSPFNSRAAQSATSGWLAALAAAQMPLRELRLRLGAVLPGHGAEAAIGQLTCLTYLDMSIDRARGCPRTRQRYQQAHGRKPTASLSRGPPLQLQLLGCGAATTTAGGSSAAARNTGLQELWLECIGGLSDAELAAAAAALPDLRRLEVSGETLLPSDRVLGLQGYGLAAFGACRRLREVVLRHCPDLDGRQLAMHLPGIGSLRSLYLQQCCRVEVEALGELQLEYQARHGRMLEGHVK